MEFKKGIDPVEEIACNPGNKIYTWSYENEEGEIIEASKNIYEEIQSYENMTNFKELIENYGGIDNIPSGGPIGIYGDVSNFGNDPDTAKQYIDSLIQEIREALTKEQTKATEAAGEASNSNTTKI